MSRLPTIERRIGYFGNDDHFFFGYPSDDEEEKARLLEAQNSVMHEVFPRISTFFRLRINDEFVGHPSLEKYKERTRLGLEQFPLEGTSEPVLDIPLTLINGATVSEVQYVGALALTKMPDEYRSIERLRDIAHGFIEAYRAF